MGKRRKITIFFLVSIVIIFAILISSSAVPPCEDDDNDGVCNDKDSCPNSRTREMIDKNGCDPFQFCEKQSCGPNCFTADFLGNEKNKRYPNDCTIVILAKEGKYKPLCVPVECKKNPYIPNSTIRMKFYFHGNYSRYATQLIGIPPGFDVNSTFYPAWCVDEYNYIPENVLFNATLYSSMDPDLASKCPHCVDPDWDKVNYIINHKKGTFVDIQAAIHYFIDGGHYPSDPDAIEMVEEAKLYGNGFWPQEGQFMAIIVDVNGFGGDSRIQLTIIEVDP